ncbi:hypothetical protein FBZ82_108200 [Azospirillum brasilense]|uniref:Uncharacterized protein n=1 Tax=Azospirillum brasilense TaxID=192 RepID=A0A560B1M8_AZOBR|nr:hypothetical protein [Azospirillum brasilense]TWA66534.1 hypothetical protein FBZ82_108200 [Azospirillum brasilense]
MHPIPRDASPDGTLAPLLEGCRFVMNRRDRHGSDIVETRLMRRKAIRVMGEEAAGTVYEPDRLTRKSGATGAACRCPPAPNAGRTT